MDSDLRQVAEQVRNALLGAAISAYEDAAMRGLCHEGAWEVAIAAMRTLDLSHVAVRPSAAVMNPGPAEDR